MKAGNPISPPPQKTVKVEEAPRKATARKGVIAPASAETGITMEGGRYALAATTHVDLPKGYRPSNDEEYMGPTHLAYFRQKLRDWREQLVEESKQTIDNLRDEVRDAVPLGREVVVAVEKHLVAVRGELAQPRAVTRVVGERVRVVEVGHHQETGSRADVVAPAEGRLHLVAPPRRHVMNRHVDHRDTSASIAP